MMRRPNALVLAALTMLSVACGSEPEPTRHSALLVTFDTTRADMLAIYGGPPGLAPNLDRLAKEGLVFEDASAVAPLTLPSHASMLTGLYPPRHGLRENGIAPLPPSARTLAEAAQEAGFQTAAFVSALVLDSSFGLDQGFDEYAGPGQALGSQSSHSPELPADVTVDRALDWLQARDRERPFFLWVHLFDPHGPYAPPIEYEPLNSKDPRAFYLGEIGFADAQMGRLLGALRKDGSLDDTFVAFAADHGESFGEHGEPTHGGYVWETTIRVPMVLRDPAGRLAGTRTQTVASVADIYPTLLEAMALPRAGSVDGQSLIPLFGGEALAADRGVYFESYSGFISYGWSQLAGWRNAGGKYIFSSRPQFFEPRKDPREEQDLLVGGDDLTQRMGPYQAALDRLGQLAPLPLGQAQATDSELFEQIRSLGYASVSATLQALPLPLEPSSRPAPQDNVDVYASALQAQEMSNSGDNEGAEAILAKLVERQPNNPFVLDRLATVLIRQSDHARAIPYLERLLEIGPGWSGSFCNLGLAYNAVGRVDEAIPMLKQAIALDDDQEFFWDMLLVILEDDGRTEELAEVRAQHARRAQD